VNDDDELHLGDYLEILRRRWVTIAVAVALVVGAAAVLSLRTDDKYRADARVLVRTTAAQDRLDPTSGSSNAQTLERRLRNEVEFATSNAVEAAADEAYGEEFDVSVRPDSNSDTLVISATAGTAEEAALRANTYAETLVAERTRSTADELLTATTSLNERIAEIGVERDEILGQIDEGADERRFAGQLAALDTEEASLRASLREIQIAEDLAVSGSARITKAAEEPAAPFEPAWSRNIALALVVGLVMGVGAALLLETLDGTLRTKAQLDAASGLPALGLIPAPGHKRDTGRPQLVASRSGPFVESMRSLRSSMMFAKSDLPDLVAFAFTSPSPSEGKTTTIVNLALAMARSGQNVVLVDADLRRPRAGEACGIDVHHAGLTEILVGRTGIVAYPEQVTGEEVFHVIPAGMDVPDPAEILSSRAFDHFVADLRTKYDIVLLDTAPILPVSDGLAVASAADATLLVAQAEQTSERHVRSALEFLQRADANVIGTVMTNVDRQREYGGYGYGYTQASRS